MSTSKKLGSEIDARNVDRLSDLPDSLICRILGYLSTKESVSTTVLAKRWRFLWSGVPNLVFDFTSSNPRQFNHDNVLESVNFPRNCQLSEGAIIRNVMSLHNALALDNFCLKYGHGDFSDSDLDEFVTEAVLRGVKNLEIECLYPDCDFISIECFGSKAPLSILNCKGLVSLKLCKCYLHFDGIVCLPRLKNLCLDETLYLNAETLPRLISGCPVLEELMLKQVNVSEFYCWSICSETLKCLNVELSLMFVGNQYSLSARESDDEEFDWDDFIWEMKTPSLTRLNLWFHALDDFTFAVPLRFLDNVPSIKLLKLRCDTVDIEKPHDVIPTGDLHNLERLDFSADWSFLFELLKNAYNLKDLIFRQVGHTMRWLRIPEKVPECLISHLETVTFVGFESSNVEFRLLKYLLKNAFVLKKVSVCCYPCQICSKGIKKLEALQKVSSKVEFHVHEFDPPLRKFFGCDVLSI